MARRLKSREGVYDGLTRISPADRKRDASYRRLHDAGAFSMWIATDGALQNGVCGVGVGALLHRGAPLTVESVDLTLPHTLAEEDGTAAAAFPHVFVRTSGSACSYRTESLAMEETLKKDEWWTPTATEVMTAIIVTDSQSTAEALRLGPWQQRSACERRIWRALIHRSQQGWRITFVFVFAHVGIKTNELANSLASLYITHPDRMSQAAPAPSWITDDVRTYLPAEVHDFGTLAHPRRLIVDKEGNVKATPKETWAACETIGLKAAILASRARCGIVAGVDPYRVGPLPPTRERCLLCRGEDGRSTHHLLFDCPSGAITGVACRLGLTRTGPGDFITQPVATTKLLLEILPLVKAALEDQYTEPDTVEPDLAPALHTPTATASAAAASTPLATTPTTPSDSSFWSSTPKL